jgi:hypothetical protein
VRSHASRRLGRPLSQCPHPVDPDMGVLRVGAEFDPSRAIPRLIPIFTGFDSLKGE